MRVGGIFFGFDKELNLHNIIIELNFELFTNSE